jgi:uncharacterized membrane protein
MRAQSVADANLTSLLNAWKTQTLLLTVNNAFNVSRFDCRFEWCVVGVVVVAGVCLRSCV